MYIELFGPPGAGKTYYAQNFLKDFNSIDIGGRLEKFFFSFLFILKKPLFFFYFLFLIYKENKNNFRLLVYKIKYLYFLIIAREGKAGFYENPVLDDGLIQFFLSIFERKINKSELSILFKHIDKNLITVYIVESHKENRVKRLKIRGRIPRKQKFGEEYVMQWLDFVDYNFDIIKLYIIENYNYKLINN